MTEYTTLLTEALAMGCALFACGILILARAERRAAACERKKTESELATMQKQLMNASASVVQATENALALRGAVLNDEHERQETTRALRAMIREMRFVRSQGTCPLLQKEKDDDSLIGPPQVGLEPRPTPPNHDDDTDLSPST